jgi:hypothetical protein
MFAVVVALIPLLFLLGAPSQGGGPAGDGDICNLPPDPGPCDGICPRWFFNPETGECEMFIWGCCEGNANNFETLEECQAACPGSCPSDVTGDGSVDVEDLIEVILAWGRPGGAADVNQDGLVDVLDLVQIVLDWGPCR